MSTMEKIEKNKVKLTFSVDAIKASLHYQYTQQDLKQVLRILTIRIRVISLFRASERVKHLENLLKHSMVRQYSMMMQLTLLCQKHTKQQLRKTILM